MDYQITRDEGFLLVAVTGEVSVTGMSGVIEQIQSHPAWQSDRAVLVDLTHARAGALSVEQVGSIAKLSVQARPQVGRARCAHLVARDLDFGMVRMWQSFVADRWNVATECFRTRAEAVAWLRAPEDSPA